jgi:hypothetical protein
MGPTYDIMRDGKCVATRHGLPSKDDSHITFPHDADLKVGDVIVQRVTRAEFPVKRVKPQVSGEQIQLIKVFRSADNDVDRFHTTINQHIGTVHGGVAGRDFHGDVTLSLTIGDVLNYLRHEIDLTDDPEKKETLLARLGEFTQHPIIVALATKGLDAVVKWTTGQP